MPKPWERYQQQDGPWNRYGQAGQPEQPEQGGPGILATAGDIVASGVTGAARGVADLAGLPGTIGDALDSGGEWLMRQAGLPTRGDAMRERGLDPGSPLSGQSMRQGLSAVTGGATDYQPQTLPGEYARTAGEFLPAAAALGPGSLGGNIARYGMLPAAASETAGQITKDTAAEPYARIAGALAGGVAGSRIAQPPQARMPTAAEIKATADYAGLKPAMQAARVNSDTYQGIVRQLRAVADDFGMVPEQHRAFQQVLNRHANQAKNTGATLQDLEILRRSLANAGQAPTNPSAGALSRRLIETLDDSLGGLSGGNLQVSRGQSIDDALAGLQHARQTWQTGAKASVIETAMQRAQNAASGYENGLRVEFRKILNNPRLSRQFNATEKLAMQQVVKGTATSNALRWLGSFGVPVDQGRNFLGSVIGGGVGSAAGSAVGGPIGAAVGGVALPAIGTAAKIGSNTMTRNHALLAEALVKGGPNANQIFADALAAHQAAGRQGLLRAGSQANTAQSVPAARERAR